LTDARGYVSALEEDRHEQDKPEQEHDRERQEMGCAGGWLRRHLLGHEKSTSGQPDRQAAPARARCEPKRYGGRSTGSSRRAAELARIG
jgi:hypothetical protein